MSLLTKLMGHPMWLQGWLDLRSLANSHVVWIAIIKMLAKTKNNCDSYMYICSSKSNCERLMLDISKTIAIITCVDEFGWWL